MAETEQQEYVPIAINSKVETEEVLGPLPEGWVQAPWGKTNRHFFVDHNTKSTTWVDPRTYYLRKHDIRDIVEGELPYAWEEVYDEVVGVYYIDHITQSHFLDAPWTDNVREQVIELHDKLNDESAQLEQQMAREGELQSELTTRQGKLAELDVEKERLEQEINNLGGPQEEAAAPLQEQLDDVNQKIEAERIEAQQVADEHDRVTKEIEELQTRLKELRAVNDRLENENKDLMNDVNATNDTINDMRNLIEMEAAQRTALEAYIKQLKMEVLQLYNPEEADNVREKDEQNEAEAQDIVVDAPLPEPGTLNPEDELAQLQARLADEKLERDRLKKLTDTLEEERMKVQDEQAVSYELPQWVKDLNINSEGATSVRVKISKKDPDTLNFSEKLMKYETSGDDSAKVPESPHNPTNENAIVPRETAYGQVEGEEDENVQAALQEENKFALGGDNAGQAQENDGVVEQNL